VSREEGLDLARIRLHDFPDIVPTLGAIGPSGTVFVIVNESLKKEKNLRQTKG
jgi:hypothetical protein